jgi:dTDP-4-dehydrorhamnose 3,5-epimerase
LIAVPDGRPRWRPLAAGSWLFEGDSFADERGTSQEVIDLADAPPGVRDAGMAQENLVTTYEAGCARGLHYQRGAAAQAKLVTVIAGSAQFLWLALDQSTAVAQVHSIVLSSASQSLFTPAGCAHGFIALDDETRFLLKMSHPVNLAQRGEIRLLSDRLAVVLARQVREDLLSVRDRHAPHWCGARPDA